MILSIRFLAALTTFFRIRPATNVFAGPFRPLTPKRCRILSPMDLARTPHLAIFDLIARSLRAFRKRSACVKTGRLIDKFKFLLRFLILKSCLVRAACIEALPGNLMTICLRRFRIRPILTPHFLMPDLIRQAPLVQRINRFLKEPIPLKCRERRPRSCLILKLRSFENLLRSKAPSLLRSLPSFASLPRSDF